MIDFIIFAAVLFAIFSLYIYFNLQTKDLEIQVIDKEKDKVTFQKIIDEINQQKTELLLDLKTKIEALRKLETDLSNSNKENIKLKQSIAALQATIDSTVKQAVAQARADSTKRQRSILKGQAMEQLAPFIHPDHQVKDYKFLGDPIDYIVYKGMSEKEEEIEIIFLDVKTGTARLTKIQKKIREAVEAGRVSFETFRPDKYLEEQDDEEE